MRSSSMRVATTIAILLLVGTCAPATSQAPITTPFPSGPPASASATPAPTPMSAQIPTPAPARPPSGWPYTVAGDSEPVFGPDGTVYHLAPDARGTFGRVFVALDSAGHEKPGWPIEAHPGSVFGSLAVGPDGSVLVDECGAPEVGCTLHRFGKGAREAPGWPYEIPADFACSAADQCYFTILDFDPNGGVYLASWRANDRRVIAIDHGGDLMPGWPIVLDEYDWSDLQLGPEGTLFAIRRPIGTPTYDPSRGKIDELAELWAFGTNGKPRSGWPVPVPNVGGYLSGRHQVVVRSLIDDIGELCSSPRRTVFTVLDLDGRTASGWPRGSTGFASFPALGQDGTLYYVSATHKVYAHDRVGNVKTGWPVAVPGAGDGCGPLRPSLAPDGTIYVVGDEVSALSSDGRPLPGWPFRLPAHVNAPCFDTECVGGPPATAISADGTVYVLVHHTDPSGIRAEVIAIDRQGRLKAGWPYRVPFDANAVIAVPSVSPDGRLLIRGGDQLLALDPDGRLSD